MTASSATLQMLTENNYCQGVIIVAYLQICFLATHNFTLDMQLSAWPILRGSLGYTYIFLVSKTSPICSQQNIHKLHPPLRGLLQQCQALAADKGMHALKQQQISDTWQHLPLNNEAASATNVLDPISEGSLSHRAK